MTVNNYRKSNVGFLILSIMLFAFCVMKVIRGANVEIEAQGGVWNYISLLYYPVLFLILLRQRSFRIGSVGLSLLIYSVISFVSGIIFLKGYTVNNIYNLLMVPYPSIVMASFFSVKKDNKLAKMIILLTYFVCLVVNFSTILQFRFQFASRPLASDIYFSLCLFPFVLLFCKNKAIITASILAEFVIVFLSGKRAGFLALVIALILYYLFSTKEKRGSKKITFLIFAIAFLVLLYYVSSWADRVYELGLYDRLASLGEDQGSGRVDIYATVLNAYRKSNILNQLFGHGVYASADVTKYMAHDDFLEALYDYGIVPAICLVWFYCALIKKCLKMNQAHSPYAPALIVSIVIGLFLSLFSFFMTNYTYVTCMAAFWGCCLGIENEPKTVNDIQK